MVERETKCAKSECENTFRSDKWLEAVRQGWRVRNNGNTRCPDHISD